MNLRRAFKGKVPETKPRTCGDEPGRYYGNSDVKVKTPHMRG